MSHWKYLFEREVLFDDKWMGENALSYQDAMKRVRQLKAEGFDMFRGQDRCWNIAPSARREKANIANLTAFRRWALKQPELKELHHDIDTLRAVAQHYELPTGLVDFTTDPEVAGYFAQHQTKESADKADLEQKASVIICAKSEKIADLLSMWQNVSANIGDDRDLYRLVRAGQKSSFKRIAAQRGIFIMTAFDAYDVDVALDLHRVYFPPTFGKSKLKKRDVFPAPSSQAERLVDQFIQAIQSGIPL